MNFPLAQGRAVLVRHSITGLMFWEAWLSGIGGLSESPDVLVWPLEWGTYWLAVVLKHGVVTDWQTFGSFDVIDLLTLRSCYWSEAVADWVIFQNMSIDRSIQVDNFCLISLRKTVACLLILTIWINQGRKNESNNTEIKITWNLNILKHSTLIFCWLSSNIYLYEDEHVHYTTYMHRIISDTGLYKG